MHKRRVRQIHLSALLLVGSSIPASASSLTVPVVHLLSRFMPASYLSIICSSFAVCITTIKFVIPTWRLYYECTRNPKPIRNFKLWLDTGMSAIFVILSGLLMVFSFVGPEKKGLQVLLSLAGGSLIIYQVGCLILFRKALLTFFRGWISVAILRRLSPLASLGSVDMFHYDGCN